MMDTVFPFGFPWPTAFYLTWYVITLCIHVVFMNYVLAGSGYLAVAGFARIGRQVGSPETPMASHLRDWLPFAVSAAVTAGVAPLLFLQILYKQDFYTANLLLFHRWMAIVPVLIAGSYLAYLLKSRVIARWSTVMRVLVGLGAFACFLFAAWSWTENHLLSQRRDMWPEFYAAQRMVYDEPQLWIRLGLWVSGSVATMVTIVSWQLWFAQNRGTILPPSEPRRAAWLAIGGIAASYVFGFLWYTALDDPAQHALRTLPAGPYLLVALAGIVLQVIAWARQTRSDRFREAFLLPASAGTLLTLLGMTIVREAVRLAHVDMPALQEQHARALAVGGLPLFLCFFAINAVLVGWCFRLVQRGRRPGEFVPQRTP